MLSIPTAASFSLCALSTFKKGSLPRKRQCNGVGSSAFLCLKHPKGQKILRRVMDLLKDSCADRSSIIIHRQLGGAGCDPGVAHALAPKEGYSFGGVVDRRFTRMMNRKTHGYFPGFREIQPGFVAFGTNSENGKKLSIMSLAHVVPLLVGWVWTGVPISGKTVCRMISLRNIDPQNPKYDNNQ